jgi:hypothetical protein
MKADRVWEPATPSMDPGDMACRASAIWASRIVSTGRVSDTVLAGRKAAAAAGLAGARAGVAGIFADDCGSEGEVLESEPECQKIQTKNPARNTQSRA